MRQLQRSFTHRRWTACTLAVCTLAGLFVATGTSIAVASTKQNISFLGLNSEPNYVSWMKGQITVFEQSHPGVTFSVSYSTPVYIVEKIRTGVASGEAPDVATMLPGTTQQQLVQAGDILNLTPYIKADKQWQSWITAWNEVPHNQYMAGSETAATNVSMGPFYIWYWKSDLAKVGWKTFPTTIDGPQGLLALSKALKKAGIPTMSIPLNSQILADYDYLFYTLESNFDPGGAKALLAMSGKYSWTSSVFVKAVDLFKKLYDDDVIYPQALQRNQDPDQYADFGTNKASSAWPYGSWMDGAYPAKDASNIGIARFPVLNSSSPSTLSQSNDLEFIVPTVTAEQKTSAHEKLVVSFLKQLNSPESQKALWYNGIMPVLASAAQGPVAKAYSAYEPQLKQMVSFENNVKYSIDENTYGPATAAALDDGIEGVLSGTLTVKTLLQQVQAANKQDHACAPNCK